MSFPTLETTPAKGRSPFSELKVALISDNLTYAALAEECRVWRVMPFNHVLVFKYWKPDIFFVESAWQGYCSAWKYRIAAYPGMPQRNNEVLAKVVAYARDCGIPCVFWNREDGVHFERFVDSALLFDTILTVDENCIERYRSLAGGSVAVQTLMFAVAPRIHGFTGFRFAHRRANFAGSYSHHLHHRRRMWQDMFLGVASDTGLGVTVFDRNSSRREPIYRYPALPNMDVRRAMPHPRTAQIYKDYLVSLNVNTIEDSTTVFSRRLVEILACGGIAVTNPTPAVERHFHDYCHVVHHAEEARALFERLKQGPSQEDLEKARAGANYVLEKHTWSHRLQEITVLLGLA